MEHLAELAHRSQTCQRFLSLALCSSLGDPAMAYKASFRPIEGLVEGVWRRL
jgi:hypothetical protein